VSDFSKVVRGARQARGWTQRDLAQRVGVSQRAVSAWELAVSEPDEDVKRRVAAALSLPPEAVSAAETHHPESGRRYAGRARLAELPLDVLEPQEFEDFAVSLLKELYPQARQPYRLGKSGHKQHGFDVVAEQDGRVRVAVQCKRVARFGPAEVNKAVAAAEMPADEAFIFLSKVATPLAHAAMRQHQGWQLWDRQRLSHAVHDLPPGASARIVDRYFPNLRYDFLGLTLLGPWLDPAGYFRRIARSEHYSHRWRLVGRSRVLDDLTAFATGERGRIGVLVGRGGIGKTKLLSAVCDRLADEQSLPVMFLDRDPGIDARSFELLPSGRLLVIIDDAHDDLIPVAKVLAGIHAANPDASVLLALRPYGEPRVRLELRTAGIHIEDVFRRELEDLDITDAEALAREVLGDRHMRYAARLAHAARDCPLLLVASAELVRRGKLVPDRLEGDSGMSRDLTEILAGAVIDDMARQSEVRIEVLHAVAALQPLRTADAEFRDALVVLTGRAYDQVAPHLAALDEAGLLLRRGETFRVVPDLLGDWLLARRSHGPGGSASTGYIDRVHSAVRGAALANLIVNAGRMEWQKHGTATGLLGGLWEAVRAEFEAGDAKTRLAIFDVLAQVAFFQPGRCLAMVRWALDHPPEHAQNDDDTNLASRYAPEAMHDRVCQVLRGVAYNPEHLPEAADLLWQLGSSDTRPPGQHQHHPMRVLGELATFQPAGPTTYQQRLVDAVQRWLSCSPAGAPDPLEVLQPMLATEGHQEVWSPRAISFRPFLVDPEAEPVAALRTRVLDLAFAQLAAPDPQRVLAALGLVGAALTPPTGGFGLEMTPELRAPWDPEFVRILGRLEHAVRNRPIPHPVLRVALRSQLQWLAEHGAAQVRLACRSVLSAIPSDMPDNLARALHGGPIDPPDGPDGAADFQYRQTALKDLFTTAISSMGNLPDQEVADEIEYCLSDLKQFLGDDPSRARPFLFDLVTARPSLAAAIADHITAAPGGMLTEQVTIVLIALAGTNNPNAVTVASKLLATHDTTVARQVAHAFGLQRGRVGQLLPGEDGLIRTLVTHHDPVVHAAALGALRTLGPQNIELAVELLACAPPERPGFAWWEIAFAAGPPGTGGGTLAWPDLPDEYKTRFFAALRDATSIENYEISELLTMLSRDEPYRAVKLLISRVEHMENGAPAGYSPLPHHLQGQLHFREHGAFPDILRLLYDWLAEAPESMWRRYYGSQLFTLIAGGFDTPVREVIDGYLQEPDSSRMTALAVILHHVPQSAVWDLDFVRRCLRAAEQCGPASLSAIQGALHYAVIAGGRWGAPSQPTAQNIGQHPAAQLADQCLSGSPEEQFYRALAASVEVWAHRHADDSDIQFDGRQW
jgi:transcriptional regulator with XRE-family HTH domain